MNRIVRIAVLAFGLVVAAAAFARSDIRDNRAWVKPEKGEKFSINGYVMGKVELYGYLGQLRDDEHITGVVLRKGASETQMKAIVSSARTLQIEAFEDDGGDLRKLDTSAPAAPATPATPATPAASATPATPAAPATPATPPEGH
jgi:hypothetical protein